ncbi:MAG TPA: hypothetical protein VK774_05575 [Solirubrobacteraceae bacterium]|nr:hypothetical protein [Solirubrobacteraceae bacterium]
MIGAFGAFLTAPASAEEGFLPKPISATFSSGKVVIETASGLHIVECKQIDASQIMFESDKHGKGTLRGLGCKFEGFLTFNSLGDKSEEVLSAFLFLVCLKPADASGKVIDEMGIAIEPVESHVEVPAGGLLLRFAGRYIGVVLTSGLTRLWTIEFSGSKGSPTVRKCLEGTSEKTSSWTLESNENKKPEAISLTIEGSELLFNESVELMDA